MPEPWFVYILRCGDGTLYTGIARDVQKRFSQHEKGKGARYTRGRAPLSIVYVERAESHGDALRREAGIRRLGRDGKERLARAFIPCSDGSERSGGSAKATQASES